MKKRWISMLLVLIMALSVMTLASCSSGQQEASATQDSAAPSETAQDASPDSSESEAAPEEAAAVGLTDFTTVDLDGNTVTQDIFADSDLTMVNIWATFCSPCISEMPELGELKAEMEGSGVNIVGIVADVEKEDGSVSEDMVATAKEIVEKTGANYTHLLPSESLNKSLLYGVGAVPTTIFVDSQGNMVGDAYVGARDKAGWQQVIDELLAQQ